MPAPPVITGFSISLPGQINEGNLYVGQILQPVINTIPPTKPVTPFTLSTSDASLIYDSSGNLRLTSYSSSLPTVSLIATDDNYTGTITLTTFPSVVSVAFDSPSQTVGPFYTLDLSTHLNVTMTGVGDPVPAITWTSSRPSVATVDQSSGLVSGLSLGVTTITASVTDYRTLKASINVTVTPNINTISQAITSAQIFIPDNPLFENVSSQAYLVIDPPFSQISSLVWSVSTPTTAYIDRSTGLIRVVNALDRYSFQNVTVKATIVDSLSNVLSTSINVNCYKKIDAIVLNPTSITSLQIGQTATIQATIYPADASYAALNWSSSNVRIATVDSNGNVTGISNGTCSILAVSFDGTSKASTVVCVQNGLSTVTSNIPATLLEGATFQVRLTATGSNSQTGWYSTVFWNTSDSTIATISNSGLITGISPGTCSITGLVAGQSGSVTYSTSITITRSVKNILVSPTALTLLVGQSKALSTIVFPSNAAVTTITWTSTDPTIATVDSSGNVTAVKVGVTSLKATADGGINVVSVIPVTIGTPITSASIVIPSTLMMGTSSQATVTVEPKGAVYDFISWGSQTTEQTSATVSQFGQITGAGLFIPNISPLSSIVTQESSFSVFVGNQFTSSFISTIAPSITIIQPVTVINMSQVYYTKAAGLTFQLFWIVYPASAYNKNLSWNSSDAKIASVDSTGLVTTRTAGDVTITVTSVDTGKVSAVTIVTVTA